MLLGKRRKVSQGAVHRQVTRRAVPPRHERGRFSHGGRFSPLSRGFSSTTGKTTTITGRAARQAETPATHGERSTALTGPRTGPLERMTGIEPALSAWEADVLPLNYIRRLRQCATGHLRCPCPHIVPEEVARLGVTR